MDILEENAAKFQNIRIHQMHEIKERTYIQGKAKPSLSYVSYFLSNASRKAFLQGQCELVPNHFRQVPRILRETTKTSLVLAAASMIDEHGYFSLGTQADYVSSFSRIRPHLTSGSVVSTSKNDVDRIVTEYGVAELRGKSIAQRTRALINIAHPKFRDELTYEARRLGFLT